jgi:hypothetical protein
MAVSFMGHRRADVIWHIANSRGIGQWEVVLRIALYIEHNGFELDFQRSRPKICGRLGIERSCALGDRESFW